MTIERLTVLWCDGECERTIPGANQSEVRKRARTDGWMLTANGDYCQDCSEPHDPDDDDSEDA